MQEILRNQIEKIVTLTDEEFDIVLTYFTPKKFKKHQYVIQEGNLAPNDYFVTKGLLKSFYIDDTGKTHILQFAPEDWWISDPQAYHNRLNAKLHVDCIENTETFFISIDNREKLCSDFKKMEYFFMKKTTAGYIALQKRILSLMSKKADERYYQFIKMYPSILQRVPKAQIASYLNVSRETLSRITSL